MKKSLRFIAFFCASLIAFLPLTSCGDDDDKNEPENTQTNQSTVVGSWVEDVDDEDEIPFYVTFNKDNTGYFTLTAESRVSVTYRQDFLWRTGDNGSGTNFIEIITTDGDEIFEDGKYACTVINNMMNFGGYRFRRL